MNKPKPAVVLLSGGIDSTTTLAIAITEGYETYALSFDYGQRHQIETEAAQRVANSLGVKEHRIAKIDLRVFGGSALTEDVAVPKQRSETEMAHGIPVTYVPARNTIFLAYALAWAEVIPANDIFIGVNAIDYSGYPDCRPEFIASVREPCQYWNQSRCRRPTLPDSHPVDQTFQSRHHPQRNRARRRSLAHPQLLRSDSGRSRLRRMRFLSPAPQRFSRSRNHRSNSLREKMKRFFRIFELSKNEQRVVLIVIFALLAITLIGYERRVQRRAVQPSSATGLKPSPTAGETVDDQ